MATVQNFDVMSNEFGTYRMYVSVKFFFAETIKVKLK
jgi:hypothetical protein